MSDIASFADQHLRGGTEDILVVSSNGILRFLPRMLLAPEAQPASFKMRTGHLGVIEDGRLRGWDIAPDALSRLV
jgi:hypothetical protein